MPSIVRGQRPSETQAEEGNDRLATGDVAHEGAFVGPAPGSCAVGGIVVVVVHEGKGWKGVPGLMQDGPGGNYGADQGDEEGGEVREEEGLCGVWDRRSMLVYGPSVEYCRMREGLKRVSARGLERRRRGE